MEVGGQTVQRVTQQLNVMPLLSAGYMISVLHKLVGEKHSKI